MYVYTCTYKNKQMYILFSDINNNSAYTNKKYKNKDNGEKQQLLITMLSGKQNQRFTNNRRDICQLGQAGLWGPYSTEDILPDKSDYPRNLLVAELSDFIRRLSMHISAGISRKKLLNAAKINQITDALGIRSNTIKSNNRHN